MNETCTHAIVWRRAPKNSCASLAEFTTFSVLRPDSTLIQVRFHSNLIQVQSGLPCCAAAMENPLKICRHICTDHIHGGFSTVGRRGSRNYNSRYKLLVLNFKHETES